MAHSGHVVEEGYAFHVAQGGAVFDGDLMTGFNCGVHLAQVEQAVGRAHFVHLAVDAGTDDCCFVGEAEVLQVVYALLHALVVHHHRAALNGVVDFGGVEAERAEVAGVEYALAVHFYAEGMGGVVDYFQAVLIGYLLYTLRIAWLAVDVYRHYGCCLGCDGGLYLVGVDVARAWVDVNEHGLYAVPPKGVGGCNEAVRSGDHLARYAQSLQCRDERQRAVGEQADVGHFQVCGKFLFKLLVKISVVGYPLARPYLFEHFVVTVISFSDIVILEFKEF